MLRTRVMPCLLLRNGSLVKTIQFKNPKYIGDPINTVRIYNEQEVDELIFLDISATIENKPINYDLLQEIASECFMPFTYGGGINTFEKAQRVFSIGIEKIALNSALFSSSDLPKKIVDTYGGQSLVASIDVKKNVLGGYRVFTSSGSSKTKWSPVDFARYVENLGVGEILLTAIHEDGRMLGYDLALIEAVAAAVNIPVIACGGAGELIDFRRAVDVGASAVAAGSIVVYQSKLRGVLTNFPMQAELKRVLE
ncbi:MAG: imidazole glycerol phosphate synthase subunit HisF [Gammaproteobacteria bacterium CG11_big_fil_rev_8_21_14_0_20_46_22]|nr:MAG: imidazole glycerol phosphate synthase subunit HisF [Gammaproteobacteria bacterium CG12_big_fil_rev_8_21_14_0_65_46_12]PIR12123.1 MAG: imidazole glycerol phosphate synthase subunit HisF [Gammaproteobacteria bacterium CG11_big_fil_rev_8_21_14_0_20_46_22]